MSSDPIADMVAIIKNGYLAKKDLVIISDSKFKEELGRILVEEGYLKKQEVQELEGRKVMKVTLKYNGKTPAIAGIKKVSKPGLRIYKGRENLPRVLSGLGTAIISTSKGLMTGKKAKKQNLGGEVICKVW